MVASVEVRCGDCGTRFDLPPRNELRHRSNGTEPRCVICRRPPVQMSDDERAKLEAWWLERMSLEEIQELAQGMRG